MSFSQQTATTIKQQQKKKSLKPLRVIPALAYSIISLVWTVLLSYFFRTFACNDDINYLNVVCTAI